jgi:glycine cleavage system H protein
MDFPSGLKYTKDHEWVRIEGNSAVVGITEFAQSELGDLVFVDLPAKGKQVAEHGVLCVVESTKAASDVYSPIKGTVEENNSALADDPSLINRAPYTEGWIVKMSGFSAEAVAGLMSAEDYKKHIGK